MRILHCIPSLAAGGAERQLSILAPAQRRAGDDVHLAFVRDGPERKHLDQSGVSLHQIAAAGNYDVRLAYRLYATVRSIRPAIVQTWLPQMDVLGGLACLATGTPWLICERSSREAYTRRLTDRLLRPLIGCRADGVVANSAGGCAVWRGVLPIGAPLQVIRNALPLEAIRGAPPTDLGTLGLKADTPIVVFVGRLAPEKNPEVLLRVAELVVRQSDAVVCLCGDGPLRSVIEARVHDIGFADRIRVLGYCQDVTGLLKIARVCISPSLFEGQPNAVLEAMACGCALVVSDIPAHREFLDDTTAALVPVNDPDRMAAEVIATLSGSPLSSARAAAAHELSSRWTPDAAIPEYRAAYQLAIGRHGQSRNDVL